MNEYFKELPTKLKGGFELILLMRSSMLNFDGSFKEMLRSFIIPLLMAPISFFLIKMKPPIGLDEAYYDDVANAAIIIGFVNIALFILIFSAFSYALKQKDRMFKMFTAGNWAAVVMMAPGFTILLLSHFNVLEIKTIEDISIVLQIYGYVILAATIHYAFDTNWQIAGAMAIVVLLFNDNAHNIIYQLMEIPIVDYSEVYKPE